MIAHFSLLLQTRPKILNNILEAIGDTPLVRLNKIPQARRTLRFGANLC